MKSGGELETEVCLPVRVEYDLDAEGHLEIIAVHVTSAGLPAGVRLDFSALEVRERRSLVALARQEADRRERAGRLEQRLSEREEYR